MSNYRLAAQLEGHEQDVRALASPNGDTIVSASRDATVRVWKQSGGKWEGTVNYQSSTFINSLAFDETTGWIASGGNDKLVTLTDPETPLAEPKGLLVGHEANVCSLDCRFGLIISGSWDKTAIVWSEGQPLYHLKGHQASVWGVRILSPTEFLTCSADGTVKRWEQDKAVSTDKVHSDAVRDVVTFGEGYITCSNDETIRISDGTVLRGHGSFVYSLALTPEGNIVSCGEDRTVRVWSPQGKCLQVLTVPAVSVWDVIVMENGDIVCGSSDGVVRIFTQDASRVASEAELKEFTESVENSTISEQTMGNIQKDKLPGPEVLQTPGEEGKVIMVKTAAGTVEAHQWTEGKWAKIGEVVGAAGSGKKQEYLGKKWDYVFDVDVKDGEPPLKLPYNANENVYVAAQRFLADNDLPNTYTEEVVRFILQNTGGVDMTQQQAPVDNPYADRPATRILPQRDYVTFETYNAATLEKGLDKLNAQQEKKLSDAEIAQLKQAIASFDVPELVNFADKIIEEWSVAGKLLGFDLLRIAIAKSQDFPDRLFEMIKLGFELIDQSPNITMMTYRCLSNIFNNKWWGEVVTGDDTIVGEIFAEANLNKMIGSDKDTHSAAVTTLLLNYAVLYQKQHSKDLYAKLIDIFAQVGGEVKSAEAAYRLIFAYGTLMYPQKQPTPWLKTLLDRYDSEQRFQDISRELI